MKRTGRGGPRKGAGRPPGSGASPDARRYRVAVMLSKAELAQLGEEAKRADLPVSTVAYQAIARWLRRQRRK